MSLWAQTDPALEQQQQALAEREAELAEREQALQEQETALSQRESEVGQLEQERTELQQQQEELQRQQEEFAEQQRAAQEAEAQPSTDPPAETTPSPAAPESSPSSTPDDEGVTNTPEPESNSGGGRQTPTQETGNGSSTPSTQDPPPQEPLPPPAKPPRPVIEINADTVLGGGPLSSLWAAFSARHPEWGLNENGHITNVEAGTTITSNQRVDSLPPEWISELVSIAKEQGLDGSDPNAGFLVAPPGGAGAVASQELERFQGESSARTQAERERDQANASGGSGGSGGENGGSGSDPGPTDPDENGSGSGSGGENGSGSENGNGGSESPEDVPDLGNGENGSGGENGNGTGGENGNGTGGENGNGGENGGETPSAPTGSPGSGAPGAGEQVEGAIPDSETPASLLSRGVRLAEPTSADRIAEIERALTFVPPKALAGSNNEGIIMLWDPNPNADSPNTAAQWEFGGGIARIRVFPLQANVEDPNHVLVHEMMHQALTLTSPDGEERINAAFDALSEEDKARALPSVYARDDPTPELFERPTEIMAFYLQNKRSDLSGNPYRDDVPASLKAVLDELIVEWGGSPL